MTEVSIKGLIQGKVRGIVVQGRVDGCVRGRNVLVLQTGEKLLEVPNTLSTTGRVAVGIIEVILDI